MLGSDLVVDYEESFIFEAFDPEGRGIVYLDRVFNFEVEDCHTYFVGVKGAWVHNTNCGNVGAEMVEASLGISCHISVDCLVFDERARDLK